MKLGLMTGYSGSTLRIPLDSIKHAESLGYDSVWTAEAYGADAVTTATWILANTSTIKVGTAIMQMPARSPAMAAMTAMALSHLSGNRFIVGLGASGPQVVEGWHGVPYGKPVTRLKEYIAIMKTIFAREAPATFEGNQYQLPYTGEGATGMGKPLKSILHCNEEIPIFAATITPAGVKAAAEVADGFFPVWMDPGKFHVFEQPIKDGFAAAGNKSLDEFQVAPFVRVIIGDDVEKCMQPIKDNLALYIGGMGARSKNFYNDYAKRLGFEEEAVKIQNLYLDGKKAEAAALVPNELVDDCNLVGPADRIRDRAQRWMEAGKAGHVSTMLLGADTTKEGLELMAEIVG
ncbi:MAG: LLM class F420-dependent oxidoreductase [Cellvibrionales bacterium]|nr:MAG: LLM class F420-dependent oxidoreductase [Cellvibrionales bacterium]